MTDFNKLNSKDLHITISKLQKRYDDFKSLKLNLNIERGRPCLEQLDLSMGLLDCLGHDDYKASDGTDCRNYGGVNGIPEAKELFSHILEANTKEIIIGGNASLNMMFDTIARAMIQGVVGSSAPWDKLPSVKFLCPSPGYDRHFAILEFFNIEMIPVDMKSDGPDMNAIEELVSRDDAIKGIFCTPKYSNPTGITYSDEIVDRFAGMKTKADDFRIFWDNAYAVHHLSDKHDHLKNILAACKEAGNPDRVFIFSSTSKISFPGSGIAMFAASESNVNLISKQISQQIIGPDKMNQLRHVRFFKNFENIQEHMRKHAVILKPRFDIVFDTLESELGGKNIGWWNKPNGGYFISFNTLEGCAKAVFSKAVEAGVKMTPAGATFPYGKDPLDRNIRIAPTMPSLGELKKAMELFCICVQLVSAQKIASGRKLETRS